MPLPCKEYADDILLAASGELSQEKQHLLQQHLQQCAACRAAAKEQQNVQTATRKLLAVKGPSAVIIQQIKTKAAEMPRQPQPLAFPSVWRIPFAAAALFVLTAGIYLLLLSLQINRGPNNSYSDLQQVRTLVALIQDDPAGLTGGEETTSSEDKMKALAFELLEFQGLDDGDLFEEYYAFGG